MTRTHYIRRGNVITLPERHTPRLELVGRHDLKRLQLHGLGRHPPNYTKDWLLVAAVFGLYVAFCYFTR